MPVKKKFHDIPKELYRNIESEGVMMRIGDGIVKACGLRSVTAGEMVIMGSKSVKGMPLNKKELSQEIKITRSLIVIQLLTWSHFLLTVFSM